ncbi:MAG: right-handed parallel beta-helix repeat-containing protein [Candidatus Eisenbacteria bacterium]
MRAIAAFPALIALTLATTTASGRTWTILPDGSGDAPTIQAGIDSAETGDEVELADGIFMGEGNRNLDYSGKAITVGSQGGDAGACIIDCEGGPDVSRRGFVFHSGEGAGSVLRGLTIRNGSACEGYGNYRGGGILCTGGSSPTIEGCVFLGNTALGVGGGLCCRESSPAVSNCLFSMNSATEGGGMHGFTCFSTLTGCAFFQNTAALFGGAVQCMVSSSVALVNCTFAANSGDHAACLDCWDSFVSMEDCILGFNTDGWPIVCEGSGVAELACCDIFGNLPGDWLGCVANQLGTNGDFSADPLFCGLENGDLALAASSPCLPGHHPEGESCGLIGAYGEGCVFTSVPAARREPATWGRVKSMFR